MKVPASRREVSRTSPTSEARRAVSSSIRARKEPRWSPFSSRQRWRSVEAAPIDRRHRPAELVRDERDEVGPKRGEPPELLGRGPLGLEGPDVLDRGRHLTAKQGQDLDVLAPEGVDPGARDRDHPEHAPADGEGSDGARAKAGLRELPVFGVARVVEHVRDHDRPRAREQVLDDAPLDRLERAGRVERVLGGADVGDDLGPPALGEDEGEAVEVHARRDLAAEELEGLVELEGRAERPPGPVRELELIRPPADLVSELLRLGRALVGDPRLVPHLADEAADDQAHDQLDPEWDGDVAQVRCRPSPKRSARNHSTATSAGSVASGRPTPPRMPKRTAASITAR